jgi:predicted DNA-binding transcriptional regulator YafY
MSWGEHVQVLEPKALIKRLKATAERVLEKYVAKK